MMTARVHRQAVSAELDEAHAAGRGGAGPAVDAVLRTDEVSRHAVRLVVVDPAIDAPPRLESFTALPRLLRAGDLVVVNDAATLPGSLSGQTAGGSVFELRLSGPIDAGRLVGVLLGPGDHRTRTEHRPPPPRVAPGDRVTIAGMAAMVVSASGRRVELAVRGGADALWQALYAAGAPVQYAHRREPLPLWSVQTAYAGRPWAAEMPSAGRSLTWEILLGLRRAGIAVASLTHAAGLSSTGDDALDRALPWPERYEIPRRTIDAIDEARARGGRVIAVGTTVVRALETVAGEDGTVQAGEGWTNLVITPERGVRAVDGLITGWHEPDASHLLMLEAIGCRQGIPGRGGGPGAGRELLERSYAAAVEHGYRWHEFGDSHLILP
jgi:S-adenosylmethionine:tRNA ribosyltransferase-isomerase